MSAAKKSVSTSTTAHTKMSKRRSPPREPKAALPGRAAGKSIGLERSERSRRPSAGFGDAPHPEKTHASVEWIFAVCRVRLRGHDLAALQQFVECQRTDPPAAAAVVQRFLLCAPASNLLCFGGDHMTVESVVGHAEIAQRGLQPALEGLVPAAR